MNCRNFIEFLLEYLSGELPPEERARFEEHIGECPDCVQYLRSYEETVNLGKRVCACEDAVVSQDVPDDLVRAILAARPHLGEPGSPS